MDTLSDSDIQHRKSPITSFITPILSKSNILAVAIYLLIALVVFAPIVANMTNLAPGIGGDTYQNLWDIWWVGYATFALHTSIWQTNLLFWPVGANLIYQTMSPIGSLISLPFQAISITFAYNVLLILGFVISALGMYALAHYIVKDKHAAFLSGAIFSFSAFHMAQAYGHINWITIGWVPLAILFFLKILESDRKLINGIWLGVTMVLTIFMGDIEQGLMLLFALLAILIAYTVSKNTRKHVVNKKLWISIGIAFAVAFVLGSWGLIPIISAITQPNGLASVNNLNDIPHNELWSVGILSFFVPGYYNGLFNNGSGNYFTSVYASSPSEKTAYIGYTVIALLLYGVYKNRGKTKLWLGISILFGWLSLGPFIEFSSTPTQIPGLYYLYHLMPVINIIREPDRFYLMFSLAVAILAAFGAKSLIERLKQSTDSHTKEIMVIGIISALFVLESSGIPVNPGFVSITTTNTLVPSFYKQIGNLTGNFSVLQLPALANNYNATPNLYPGIAIYYQTYSHKPLVGGYVTRENLTQELSLYNIPLTVQALGLQLSNNMSSYLSPVNQNLTNETLLTLYNYDTLFVSVEKSAYTQQQLLSLEIYLLNTFGMPIYNTNTTIAFNTQAAISNSIFRSFVAYPILAYWPPASIPYNGTVIRVWVPLNPGPVIVYAPYLNTTRIQDYLASPPTQYVNATLSFDALALNGSSTLYLEGLAQNNPYMIATINVTSGLKSYAIPLRLTSGPIGNELFFLASNYSRSPIGLSNITFSRRS